MTVQTIRRRRPGGQAPTPAAIETAALTGLVHHWRADTGVALVDGPAVTSWIDSVGGAVLAPTNGVNPTYLVSDHDLGGRPSLSFVDSNNNLAVTLAAAVPQPLTTLWVGQQVQGGTLALGPIIGSLLATTNTNGIWTVQAGPNGRTIGALTPPFTSSCVRWDQANTEHYCLGGGPFPASASPGSNALESLVLARFAIYRIAELAVLNQLIDLTELPGWNEHLRQRYQLPYVMA